MIDLVVDTNVLVAAFRSSLGASYRLLQTVEHRRWRPVISPALAFECESVLKRDVAALGLTLADIDDFTEYLCSRARLVKIHFQWRLSLTDPGDDCILEAAVSAGAPIVTFNKRDFRGSERFGIRTVTPRELLAIIGDKR